MYKKTKGTIKFYQSEKLIKQTLIDHFFSTQKGNAKEIEHISNEIELD